MRTRILAGILTLALSFSRRAEAAGLQGVSQAAGNAAAARSPEEARRLLDTAWDAKPQAAGAVVAGDAGMKRLPAYTPKSDGTLSPVPSPMNGRGGKSIAERRKEIRRKRALGRFLRGAGLGLGGFLLGAAFGWAIGGAVGGLFVMKAPNPKIHKWRYALLLPAIAVGAVAGAVAMPFLLGWTFSKAEPYPTKGIPDFRWKK